MILKNTRHVLIWVGLLAALSIAALLALGGMSTYQRELTALEQRAQAEVRLLTEHATLSLGTAILVIDELDAQIRSVGLASFEQDVRKWEHVREMLARTPQLAHIGVMDEHGSGRFTTSIFPAPLFNISHRDYFNAHAQGEPLHIGAPIEATTDGRPLIPVTRRRNGPAGEFRGVLFASLDLTYFNEFYKARVGDRKALRIGMFLQEGVPLSVYPALPPEALNHIGQRLSGSGSGVFTAKSPVDGRELVVASHNIDPYPVTLAVAYDKGAYLGAKIRPYIARSIIILMTFGAGIVGSIAMIHRAVERAERARDAQQTTEQLSRALIRHLPNGRVSVVDRNMRFIFADGQCFNDHPRLASSRIVGKTMRQVYTERTLLAMEPLVSQGLAGHEAEIEVAYKGRTYKVMAAPLANAGAQAAQCMLLTQDVTDFKQQQEALTALSTTDSLLNIANRREFDRVIAQEWQRAVREQQPLGLLMIDVDAFKLYNDTYGHPAGDACLQSVAATLKDAVQRPTDLVARYGGEEMAILLPGTDLDGTLSIAERVHHALAREAIPFPASGIADRITVSIGAASVLPSRTTLPATLVEQADAEVYAAKHAGRNRTHPSASDNSAIAV